MTKLTLIPLTGLAMVLALLVGACKPAPRDSPQANTLQACNDIHHYISAGALASHEAETVIKLSATRSGVPESIRNAVDSYYRGDRAAGQRAMLTSCADAGFPQ